VSIHVCHMEYTIVVKHVDSMNKKRQKRILVKTLKAR